jgi:hypothetical protein
VAALGIFGDEADAAVVAYQLTGSVSQATYDPTLVGLPMYLRWSVDSAAIVDNSWLKSVPIIDFQYGVEGTSEHWAGTGGSFGFSTYWLNIGLSAGKSTYTQQGTFVTSQSYFTYNGLPAVSDWTAEGLPAAFAINFFGVSTSPFRVSNSGSSKEIIIGSSGVTLAMIPEPTTAALLGLGGLAALRRRKRGHD